MAEEIGTFLKDGVASTDRETSRVSAQMLLSLPLALHQLEDGRAIVGGLREYWDGVSKALLNEAIERVQEIAQVDPCVALRCYWHQLLPLPAGLSYFGIPFLVMTPHCAALGNVTFFPAGVMLVDAALDLRRWMSEDERRQRISGLEGLAELFLNTSTPWVRRRAGEAAPGPLFHGYWTERNDERRKPVALSSEGTFSLICLLAMDLELTIKRRESESLKDVLRREKAIPENVRRFLSGRLSEPTLWQNEDAEALDALHALGMNSAREDLLRRWARGEVDFIATRGRRAVEGPRPKNSKRDGRSPTG